MTIEEMIEIKNEHDITYEQIASSTGIPFGTVQKVLGGITKSPRHSTMVALSDYFALVSSGCVREDSVTYGNTYLPNTQTEKKPGEYTIDDYLALPDDQRVELIDGVFYDMSAPTTVHQIIGTNICHQLLSYIHTNKGKCIPLVSPCDVQLDKDDKTIVQPDVMVVCDRDKVIKARVYGAPEFIVEILSPSTKKKDLSIKLNKYLNAGVREYWAVDPDKLKVIVYDLENDCDISIYSFEDLVPVKIYDGKCKIDFKTIYDAISFLLD